MCSKQHHSNHGRQQVLSDVKTIHTINYRISRSYLHYTVLLLQFAQMRALQSLVLICSTNSECYSNLFHFQTNIYNGLVFENATYFAFLLCYLKILFILTPMIDAMETHLQS